MVPVEQLSLRQGDVRHDDHRPDRRSGVRRRRARAPPTDNGDGTTTWSWGEDDPTSTYLVTATNGNFDYTETFANETATGRRLPVYNALDPSASAASRIGFANLTGRNSALIDFFGERFGPYPFDSYGAIYDVWLNTPFPYALEVSTKSHFPNVPSSVQQGVINGGNAYTYAHELMHQWFGNAVTLERWNDIWFNEGWAQFVEWEYGFEFAGDPLTPDQAFADIYDDPGFDWSIAPAVLDNDPVNLFNGDATYARAGALIQGYRMIIGDSAFFDFAKTLQAKYAYGNISTPQFVDEAKDASGYTGSDLLLLDRYFEQWLYGTEKPTVTPADF